LLAQATCATGLWVRHSDRGGGWFRAAVDDGLLSFFAAAFAPVKFERLAERLAETLLR